MARTDSIQLALPGPASDHCLLLFDPILLGVDVVVELLDEERIGQFALPIRHQFGQTVESFYDSVLKEK